MKYNGAKYTWGRFSVLVITEFVFCILEGLWN